MDFASIVPILFMFTLLSVIVFALTNKKAVEERAADPNAPKSTLAKDGPQGGIALLMGRDHPRHRHLSAETSAKT